ncbi:hypothetical protein M422DRAFT_41716 [Sphaerobolus stellatus SS14]|nr:hypothetical protein M422DRAFT_41716 [Sphaerobolus stellatus SS14]
MSTDAAGSGLALDPGTIPKRKRPSICKGLLCCMSITGLVFVVLGAITIFIAVLDPVVFPHRSQYATRQELAKGDPSLLVKPLVNETQTFDIAVTVWMRDGTVEVSKDILPKEIPLFSDVIFKGLTLKDKRVVKRVNFEIPTALFRSHELSYYDLRAGFTLIPTFPSPLDYAANYSSWITSLERLPLSINRPTSLREQIIEANGINVPLIEFHEARTFCEDGDSSDVLKVNDELDEDDWLEQEFKFGFRKVPVPSPPRDPYALNKAKYVVSIKDRGESFLEKHPHVVTKSHIRVADFTRPFNRERFLREHIRLKSYACQPTRWGPSVLWGACIQRSFWNVGNFETHVKLGIPVATRNRTIIGNRTEYAYAPHLAAQPNAHGPKDLIPFPVNREDCDPERGMINDTLAVTWRISYSGRSALKMLIGDNAPEWNGPNIDASDQGKFMDHHDKAYVDSLFFGHSHYDNYHPWRQLISEVLSQAL